MILGEPAVNFQGCALPETNSEFTPAKGWWEECFSFWKAYFQGLCQFFGGYLSFAVALLLEIFFQNIPPLETFFNHVIDIFISQWETGHGGKKTGFRREVSQSFLGRTTC